MYILSTLISKLKKKKFLGLLTYTYRFLISHNIPTYPKNIDIHTFQECRNVLVLSPHQDDETFGMGGLIYLLTQQGVKVDIVWFLHADNSMRVSEASKLLQFLGLDCNYKFSFPIQGDILTLSEAEKVIHNLLKKGTYDLVCIPSFSETHHDHITLYQAFKKSILQFSKQPKYILQYEVWNTLIPNVLLDISQIVSSKERMMNFFSSQIGGTRDYIGKILALNKYRGLSYSMDYAEAYILLTTLEFINISHD